ncbi:F0F1 ATP synthase subunit B [Aminobacter sp. HY435]|uniref:F0F1 ATP synthase subunit B n=1 Tax=Aminobacter sp. HY435 TaxID=2970917 RepID=UPI0022B9C0A1|nr:F0F1 ATP synthase subunit B [Aminobacter sp. HY435]
MFVTPGYAEEVAPAAGDAHTTDAGAQAHTEAAGGGGVFPPFDSTTYPSQVLWLAITFGLFYLFLKNVVLPRVGGTLEVRRDRIAGDLDQAARMKSEADAAVAAYEQELAQAKGKANAIGQDARDGAKAEAEGKRKEIEAGLEQKLAAAEARIATIKANAMKEVGNIAEDTAHAIVQALGAGKVEKADIAAAVKAAGK